MMRRVAAAFVVTLFYLLSIGHQPHDTHAALDCGAPSWWPTPRLQIKRHGFYVQHVVTAGETLWGLSEQYLQQPRRYEEIIATNGLTTTVIHPGDTLLIHVSPVVLTACQDTHA